MTDAEILAAVEAGLVAQGNGETVIEPRVHLEPDPAFRGHFNVLRGYVAPLDMAGVKIVGDYVDNYLHGLPSEFGILNLFDPRTGMPRAILDATVITDMRTGAVTAIGAKHLARKDSQHPRPYRRARHRLLERAAARPSVRFRRDPRAFAPAGKPRRIRREACRRDLGKPVRATEDWRDLRRGRRYRRRGVAPAGAAAAAQDRMDQAGRAGRALRHDERGRAVADRHHGARSSSTTGASARAASSARCAPMSRPAG